MSANQVTKYDPSVPAYLQLPGWMDTTFDAGAGIGSFDAPPRISIRGGRFHLVDADGQEVDSQEHNGVALDVIVVGAGKSLSKLYYPGAYDPSAEAVQPACFSDNGVGPSERASDPQSPTCSSCPHNAWGSKITPSGSKVKACSDLKKLAVILESNPTGAVYQLAIPAASLKGWQKITSMFATRGVPIMAVSFRATFDTAASYPKLVFSPKGWIPAETAQIVQKLIQDGTEIGVAVGSSDRPVQALAAPTASPAETQRLPSEFPPQAGGVIPLRQETAISETGQQVEEPTKKRGRPKKEAEAKTDEEKLDIPPFLDKRASAQTKPASNELDAMLDNIMGAKG